jgi:uncharacterized protein DUF4360
MKALLVVLDSGGERMISSKRSDGMKGRQKMNTMLKSLLLAVCVMAPAYAFADEVHLTSLNFAGSGCSAADASGRLLPADDPTPDQFVVDFGAFIAFQPSDDIRDRLKSCTITAGFHIPKGLQISITSVEYEGAADLPNSRVYARQKSTYEFPTFSNEVTAQTVLRGRYNDGPGFPRDYSRTDTLFVIAWSPCGIDAPLEIETQVALGGTDRVSPALMTLDNVNGRITQTYHIRTRTCL